MEKDEQLDYVNPYALDMDSIIPTLQRIPDEKAELCREYERLQAELVRIKAEKELVRSELYTDISRNPINYEIDKTTKDMVDSTVVMQQEYKDVIAKEAKALEELGTIKAGMSHLESLDSVIGKMLKFWSLIGWSGDMDKLDNDTKSVLQSIGENRKGNQNNG